MCKNTKKKAKNPKIIGEKLVKYPKIIEKKLIFFCIIINITFFGADCTTPI